MEKRGKQQQAQGGWRRSHNVIRSMLAFQGAKQRLVPVAQAPGDPDNGPVPISKSIVEDIDKKSENFIKRKHFEFEDKENERMEVLSDHSKVNKSNGSLVSPGQGFVRSVMVEF